MVAEFSKIEDFLVKKYGLKVKEILQMTMGVGGETYKICTDDCHFILKVSDSNEMNHPKEEPAICDFLLGRGIPVSEFLRNTTGDFVTPFDERRVCHVQKFVEGRVFGMNEASEWFLQQTPLLLGRIHRGLQGYKELPVGIGENFFQYMTPERARQSYMQSYKNAEYSDETDILEDLEVRLKVLEKMADWSFDVEKLTYRNSHGDYTVNQIIAGERKINAVIDWTCACRQPVIWEITRSFFYAAPGCAEGGYDERVFQDYVDRYCSEADLNAYDKENLLKLYFYQLAVCDYYAQYFGAEASRKDEYLQQARFATKVLKNSDIN